MAHRSSEELVTRLQAAREAGKEKRGNPLQLKLLRELVEDCPAFTPSLLYLARSLLLGDEPASGGEEAFGEIERLLEQAVLLSDRSAPALVELAYFHDSVHNDFGKARPLYTEGANKALADLEDAWAGLLTSLVLERHLSEALALAQQAERVFPASGRIMRRVHDARELAIAAGLLSPESEEP